VGETYNISSRRNSEGYHVNPELHLERATTSVIQLESPYFVTWTIQGSLHNGNRVPTDASAHNPEDGSE